jgi:hypothetical protein
MPPTESAMVAVDSFDLFKLAHSVFTFFKFWMSQIVRLAILLILH